MNSNNKVGTIRITKDAIPRALFTWVLYESIIFQLLAYASGLFGVADFNDFANTVYFLVFGFLAISTIVVYINAKRRIFYVESFITVVLVILYWFLLTKDNLRIINSSSGGYDSQKLFLFYLPVVVFASSYERANEWIDSLLPINLFMNICSIWFLFRRLSVRNANEALLIAYMIALCLIVNVYFYKKNSKMILLPIVVVDIIVLFGAGNRGSILTGIGYIAFLYIEQILTDEYAVRKILKIVGIIVIIFLIYLLYTPMVMLVGSLLNGIGLSNRVIDFLISGDFASSIGREYIHDLIWSNITVMPVWGYGLLGDRFLSNGVYYIHNLEMEIIIDFGWIVGGIILVVIAVNLLKTIINKRTRNVILLVGSYTLIQLQFSLSFLSVSSFWLFIGLLWSAKRQIRYETIALHRGEL